MLEYASDWSAIGEMKYMGILHKEREHHYSRPSGATIGE